MTVSSTVGTGQSLGDSFRNLCKLAPGLVRQFEEVFLYRKHKMPGLVEGTAPPQDIVGTLTTLVTLAPPEDCFLSDFTGEESLGAASKLFLESVDHACAAIPSEHLDLYRWFLVSQEESGKSGVDVLAALMRRYIKNKNVYPDAG